MKKDRNALGEYLKDLRQTNGLSLKELASKIDTDYSLLSRIEAGERNLNLDIVPAIAEALNIDFKSLQTDLLALKVAEEYNGEEFALEGLKMAVKQLEKSR
jgi:transcriptional regulator with XRE-family HTH domain